MTDLPERTSNNSNNQGRCGNRRSTTMQNTMEQEIIPRLVLSCRSSGAARSGPDAATGNGADADGVEAFAGCLIAEDTTAASRYLSRLRRQGAALEDIYLDLFAPAAHYLGYLWEQDLCDIVDVTLGVGRLQQMVRELSPEFQTAQGSADQHRRVLLLPIPGEQHTFGLTLMAEFFRRANWHVWGWPLVEDADLMTLVREQWFAVIGITVGGEVSLAGLKSLVQAIRRESGNPSVGVMVGGPIFLQQPQLTRQVGADATAVDARQAVCQAESLLELL